MDGWMDDGWMNARMHMANVALYFGTCNFNGPMTVNRQFFKCIMCLYNNGLNNNFIFYYLTTRSAHFM